MYDASDLPQFFSNAENANLEVHIFHLGFGTNRWGCHLKGKCDNVSIEVKEEGDHAIDVLCIAMDKFRRAAGQGVPKMLAPQLEHKPGGVTPKQDLDDEIPF